MSIVTGGRRQLLLGSGAFAGVVVFAAILIGVQYIILQHPERWDLTQAGTHTLAPQSAKIIEDFREKEIPLQTLIFLETKEMAQRDRIEDLMLQYRDRYPEFSYRFIDPDKQRALAMKYEVDSYPSLIVEAADKSTRMTKIDEENFTNALIKLLRTDAKKVYFLQGHGEMSIKKEGPENLTMARDKIEKQNYLTEELVLAQKPEIPEDTTILLVAGPDVDPLDAELELIGKYLDRGGSLLVMLKPFKTPKLTEFLGKYGFVTANDIVVDQMSRALGGDYLMPAIMSYNPFPITEGFNLVSFFPEARSVGIPEKPVPNVVVKELAKTSPVSWTITEEQLKSGNATFNEKTGRKGPISVMAVSTYTNMAALNETASESNVQDEFTDESSAADTNTDKKSTEQEKPLKPPKARIVTFGSSEFASDRFFNLQGNGELFLNTISWLAEDENLIAIRPDSSKAEPVVLTARQSTVVFLVPVVLSPLLWFVIGATVFLSRRRTVSVQSV